MNSRTLGSLSGSVFSPMETKTNWKVEGTAAVTKIIANCPVCHSGETFHDVPAKEFMSRRFMLKHSGCNGLLEPIPTEIRDEYMKRKIVDRY